MPNLLDTKTITVHQDLINDLNVRLSNVINNQNKYVLYFS